jgi:amino acid transporter
MKTSTIIRFVLAVLFATLACVGLLFGITGIVVLWVVPYLLLMERSEFTRQVSRKELWIALIAFGVLLALIVVLDILHIRGPEPSGVVRLVLGVVMWIAWMAAIFYRWRREKRKTDA